MPPSHTKLKAPLFLFFLFFMLPALSLAQQHQTDSLLANLPLEKDTNYVIQLQQIIPQLSDQETRMQYLAISLDLSEKLNFLNGKADALLQIGRLQMKTDEFEAALETFEKVLPISKQLEDISLEFTVYIRKAATLLYYGKADDSFQYLLKALKIAKETNRRDFKATVYYQLGQFHRLQHNFDAAIEHYKKAQPFYQTERPEKDYCWLLSCIAMTYKRFDDLDKKREGIRVYEEILAGKCSRIESLWTRAKHHNNLGSAYVDIGDLEKGEEVLFKALEMKREVNNLVSLAYTLNEISSLYAKKDDFQKSLNYAKEAYGLIVPENEIYLSYDITRNLSKAYYKTGNYKEGFEMLKQFQHINDIILNEEKATALAEMSSKYELEKKENDLAQKDLLIAYQNSRFNQYLMIGILILGLLLGFYFWSRLKWQKQRLEAKKLQELDELKSSFFTNITHEFRTPLTVILNSFSNKKVEKDQVILSAKEANIIQRNTERLGTLINQLLDLSKLEAGKMQLQVSKNDLSQYLKVLTQSYQSLAAKKNIKLQFISKQTPLNVFFDADKIEKILANLISNAVKFTQENGEINILLLPQPNSFEIIVKDNGIGIPKEKLPYIFDRFHQLDNSTTRDFEGSGIGLALVSQIVKNHQGTIKVESEVSKGTSFIIRLPDDQKQYAEHQIISHTAYKIPSKTALTEIEYHLPSESAATDNHPKPVVLIIEDDHDLRFLIKKQLDAHYKIIQANDGAQGLEKALEKIPDLIISDVMMPKLSGYEVCKRLKEDERTSHIPFILLSAKATQTERLEGLVTGADSYLIKPFDKKELEIRVSNLITQRKQLQQKFAKEVVYRTQASPVISREDAFIQKLLEIIETNMANDNFGVEELAQAVHMSRSQLYRKLKALTDKTPNNFMREIRLNRAKELLENDAGNVSEIAQMVGFSNTNYFYKCFKQAYNITPGDVLRSGV